MDGREHLPPLVLAGALIVLTALSAIPGAQQQPVAPLDQRGLRFRSGVDLVRLSVTAKSRGQTVHDLKPEEFEIYEDGVRQEMGPVGHHDTPISVIVLLDTSASMSDEKLMHAKDGVVEFVQALKKGDEALVIAFNDSVDALGGFGLNAKIIERAVRRVEARGGTRLYDAVIEGALAIARPDRNEKRALLILSDGADTTSTARLPEAVRAIQLAEVPAYAIAIEYGENGFPARGSADPLWRQLRGPSEVEPLNRMTDGTGGWTYSIQAAKRCKEICLLVADELRNQYVLGYYPSNRELDGQWRTVEVRTTRPGVTLATRSGYFAPGR